MGDIYRAACPKCGYEGTFQLGGGLMSPKPAFCLRVLPEEERARLQALLEEGKNVACMAENVLLKGCCGGDPLVQRAVVTATDGTGAAHTFGNRCPDCGNIMEPWPGSPDRNAAPVPCPLCGEALGFQRVGFWD